VKHHRASFSGAFVCGAFKPEEHSKGMQAHGLPQNENGGNESRRFRLETLLNRCNRVAVRKAVCVI
jgi:hypothetical protein